MNTISRAFVIGTISGPPTKKQVNGKNLAEFQIDDCGLKISAWDQLAAQVPSSGIVVVEGKIATRSYTYQNQERTSVEIKASSITKIETDDQSEPF